MESPLQYDKKLQKEFGIDSNTELDEDIKIGYVRSQIEEMKKALWRVRTDSIIAQHQVETATDDNMKAKHQSQLAEHRMILGQFVRSVKVLNTLLNELEPTE